MAFVNLLEPAKHMPVGFRKGLKCPGSAHSAAPVKRLPTFLRWLDQKVNGPVDGLMDEADRHAGSELSIVIEIALHDDSPNGIHIWLVEPAPPQAARRDGPDQ